MVVNGSSQDVNLVTGRGAAGKEESKAVLAGLGNGRRMTTTPVEAFFLSMSEQSLPGSLKQSNTNLKEEISLLGCTKS